MVQFGEVVAGGLVKFAVDRLGNAVAVRPIKGTLFVFSNYVDIVAMRQRE